MWGFRGGGVGVFCGRGGVMVMAAGAAFAVVVVMFVSVVVAAGVAFAVVMVMLVRVVMATGAVFTVVVMVLVGMVVRVFRLFVGESLYLVWLGRHGVSLLHYMKTCSYVHVFILEREGAFVNTDYPKKMHKRKSR